MCTYDLEINNSNIVSHLSSQFNNQQPETKKMNVSSSDVLGLKRVIVFEELGPETKKMTNSDVTMDDEDDEEDTPTINDFMPLAKIMLDDKKNKKHSMYPINVTLGNMDCVMRLHLVDINTHRVNPNPNFPTLVTANNRLCCNLLSDKMDIHLLKDALNSSEFCSNIETIEQLAGALMNISQRLQAMKFNYFLGLFESSDDIHRRKAIEIAFRFCRRGKECCVCNMITRRKTHCDHTLCVLCNDKLKHNTCPMCREDLNQDDE